MAHGVTEKVNETVIKWSDLYIRGLNLLFVRKYQDPSDTVHRLVADYQRLPYRFERLDTVS